VWEASSVWGALLPKGEGMPPYWGLYRVPRCPLLPAWTLAPAPVPREARRRKGCPAHGGLRLVYRDERDNEPSRPPPPARSHSSGIRGSDNTHCVEGRADVADRVLGDASTFKQCLSVTWPMRLIGKTFDGKLHQ
jgi:hypothetical protein